MISKRVVALFNKRIVRIFLGLVAGVLFVFTFVPHIVFYDNVDGIINARTITLTSPIEGVFSFSLATPRLGEPIHKNQVVATVKNARLDKSYLYGLKTDKASLEERIESFKRRIATLSALEQSLYNQSENYRKFTILKLEAEHSSYLKELASVDAEFQFYKTELLRHQKLEKSDSISRNRLDETTANFNKTKSKKESLEFLAELTATTILAAKDNTFLGDGHNDVPYSLQRYDEVTITKSELVTNIEESEQRVSALNQQIQEEESRLALAYQYDVISPFNGIVWRLPVLQNSTVVINSELIQLMDCDSLYLDVIAAEKDFDNIKPGMKVEYRLHGDSTFFVGYINYVRGSGIIDKDKNVAATIDSDGRREFSMTINITQNDVNPTFENYCQVGRRVVVRFPQQWNISPFLKLFDVF